MVSRAALASIVAVAIAGCGGASRPRSPAAAHDELTLYRDRALVQQRVVLDIPSAGATTVTAELAAGVDAEEVVLVDRGALTIHAIRGATIHATPVTLPVPLPADEREEEPEDDEPPAVEPPAPDPLALATPTRIVLDVTAPRGGRYAIQLAYVTDRLPWEAAYTMTTTPARERVTLRGAVTIENRSGIVFRDARVFVIDAELGPWRGRIAERLGAALGGPRASTTPLAEARALGRLDLGPAETRVELLPADPPRPMRSVLVYDPIGTRLDHAAPAPIRDASLGVGEPSPRVIESFEIPRDPVATAGLPGGAVRLLERSRGGALVLLGEARLFDLATRVAAVDTVAVGVADGVRGRRERRELTIDDDRKRVVEEFVLTIDNRRDRPVEVVLREHLYRGQNWTLAYQTGRDAKKEGPQQISLRTNAPARGTSRILYVVVYTWP